MLKPIHFFFFRHTFVLCPTVWPSAPRLLFSQKLPIVFLCLTLSVRVRVLLPLLASFLYSEATWKVHIEQKRRKAAARRHLPPDLNARKEETTPIFLKDAENRRG